MEIIRSDRLVLKANSVIQREALSHTLSVYRRLVRDLMSLAFVKWPTLGALNGNEVVQVIEGLIHRS